MIDNVCFVVLDSRGITTESKHSDEFGLSFCFGRVYFDRQFGQETRLSEFCPKTAGSVAERDWSCSS